ncbi:hypothetical protein Mapa_010873 [Marchantia paleacea]|nr:hypothetical protein Mapa_010873 [Marchantia paleacea]
MRTPKVGKIYQRFNKTKEHSSRSSLCTFGVWIKKVEFMRCEITSKLIACSIHAIRVSFQVLL